MGIFHFLISRVSSRFFDQCRSKIQSSFLHEVIYKSQKLVIDRIHIFTDLYLLRGDRANASWRQFASEGRT